MRQTSTSNGWRSLRSVDSGLRPSATEISLLAPPNFPLGDAHVSSAMSLVFTLRMWFPRDTAIGALQPALALEPDHHAGADHDHDEPQRRVGKSPVQFRHLVEVHAVHAHDERERNEHR